MVSINKQPIALRDRLRRMVGSSRDRAQSTASATAESTAQLARLELPAPGEVELGLPYLPSERPRPITPPAHRDFSLPSSATETGIHVAETEHPPNSIFKRLPLELRRAILVAAFGERKIHVDLRSTRPTCKSDESHRKDSHCQGRTPLAPDYRRNRPEPFYGPHWWSCVCHCDAPPWFWERQGYKPAWPPRVVSCMSGYNSCIQGERALCDIWEPDKTDPKRCFMGVMGWLLTCRQAYVEGIDVLYSSNTFCVQSRALFDAWFRPAPLTHHLILPERLASITSLELTWDITLFGPLPSRDRPRDTPSSFDKDLDEASTRARFWLQLRYLCQPFPNLQRLVLCFTGSLYNDRSREPCYAMDNIVTTLLDPLATAIARLPQLRVPVVVELPDIIWRAVCSYRPGSTERLLITKSTVKEHQYWIHYPVPSRPGQDSNAVANSDGASLATDLAEDAARETSREGRFYYIARGTEDCILAWDWEGKIINPYMRCGM